VRHKRFGSWLAVIALRTPWLAALGFAALALAMPAHADVFRPAYLQLQQLDHETYEVKWRVPALDAQTTLKVKPVFPPGTVELSPRHAIYTGGALTQRWRARIPGGLEGKPIGFTGLAATNLDVLVRVERADHTEQLARILTMSPTFTLRASPDSFEVVRTYTVLGIGHILMGVDHLLFVLALIMIVPDRRRLIVTITAFTIAHSISLALATLQVVHVPGPPVEATIALSIVFVAAEILHRRQGHEGLAVRKPWVIAFSFGLLHGLGFAGALAEVGLPQNSIPLALLFFNVGVEIGQLLFIGAVLGAAALFRRLLQRRWPGALDPRWTVVAPAYGIGAVASYWVIQRTAAFWG
jgi:hydrogenase/urease accessory protein HupE